MYVTLRRPRERTRVLCDVVPSRCELGARRSRRGDARRELERASLPRARSLARSCVTKARKAQTRARDRDAHSEASA